MWPLLCSTDKWNWSKMPFYEGLKLAEWIVSSIANFKALSRHKLVKGHTKVLCVKKSMYYSICARFALNILRKDAWILVLLGMLNWCWDFRRATWSDHGLMRCDRALTSAWVYTRFLCPAWFSFYTRVILLRCFIGCVSYISCSTLRRTAERNDIRPRHRAFSAKTWPARFLQLVLKSQRRQLRLKLSGAIVKRGTRHNVNKRFSDSWQHRQTFAQATDIHENHLHITVYALDSWTSWLNMIAENEFTSLLWSHRLRVW